MENKHCISLVVNALNRPGVRGGGAQGSEVVEPRGERRWSPGVPESMTQGCHQGRWGEGLQMARDMGVGESEHDILSVLMRALSATCSSVCSVRAAHRMRVVFLR